jgi:hypothetical protein
MFKSGEKSQTAFIFPLKKPDHVQVQMKKASKAKAGIRS